MLRLVNSFTYPFIFVSLLWIIMIFQVASGISFANWGVVPLTLTGLRGIITMPLVHAGYMHLWSNTFPLIVLGAGVNYFYPEVSGKTWMIIYLGTGILVWLFARQNDHIGASGIIYGLAAFLFFGGIFRKDNRLRALSLIILIYYGGIFWGVFPIDPHISWEGHLFGACTGVLAAFIFRNSGPKPQKPEWINEIEQDDGLPHISHYFEVNP